MDAGPVIANVVAVGVFALTAIAAWVAVSQAHTAKLARDDAQQARDDAADHEQKALEAFQKAADAADRSAAEAHRTANALEAANELTRSLIPDDVLVLERPTDKKYAVRNVSKKALPGFRLVEVGGPSDVTVLEQVPTELLPGRAVPFILTRHLGSPPTTIVTASWDESGNAERATQEFTIV